MKTYIENALVNGKYRLPVQYTGLTEQKFKDLIISTSFTGYEIPAKQSLNCTWVLRFHFDNATSIDISALCTNIGGWQEMGSLKIIFHNEDQTSQQDSSLLVKRNIGCFSIAHISLITFDDDNVYAECGVIFCNDKGDECVVATAPAPGAVTVKLPSQSSEFQPEMLLSDCQRITL